MNPQEQALTESLRAHGYKLTQARRAVIHALTTSPKPLTVNGLHERAQKIDHALGLVTVYRTLELLVNLDLARPVHLMDNCHGYAVATPGHTHHMVCQRCSNVVEINGCDLSEFLGEVARQTGYRITGHWLEVEGLCAACQAAQTDDSHP